MTTNLIDIEVRARDHASGAVKTIRGNFKNFAKHAKESLKSIGPTGQVAMAEVSASAEAAGAAVDSAFAANPIGAIIAAATALAGFFSAAVDDAAEYQKATVNLRAALSTLGPVHESAVKSLQDYADQLQSVTTLSREDVMGVEAMGASLGHFTGGGLKTATTAAIGFAAAYKVNASQAMKLFSEVAGGGAISLSRYGIVLPKTATAQEKLNALMRIGTKDFALAKAKTDTLGGSWTQLKHTLGDFMATAGRPVMLGLMELFKGASAALTAMGAVFHWSINVMRRELEFFWSMAKKGFAALGHIFATLMPGWIKHWVGAIEKVTGALSTFFGWIGRKSGQAFNAIAAVGADKPTGSAGNDSAPTMPKAFGAPLAAGKHVVSARQIAREAVHKHHLHVEYVLRVKREEAREQHLKEVAAHKHAMIVARDQHRAEQAAKHQALVIARKQHEDALRVARQKLHASHREIHQNAQRASHLQQYSVNGAVGAGISGVAAAFASASQASSSPAAKTAAGVARIASLTAQSHGLLQQIADSLGHNTLIAGVLKGV